MSAMIHAVNDFGLVETVDRLGSSVVIRVADTAPQGVVYPVARARAAELNWQLVEGTASWAEPGGIVSQQTWEFLRDQLLSELRAAMPVDIVLLGLHGAMVAQQCLDCEGELISAVREIVGPEVLIGAPFDPHSHLTQAQEIAGAFWKSRTARCHCR